jgi:hypothetical protein
MSLEDAEVSIEEDELTEVSEGVVDGEDDEVEEVDEEDESLKLVVRMRGRKSLLPHLFTRLTDRNEAVNVEDVSVEDQFRLRSMVGLQSLQPAESVECRVDVDKIEIIADSLEFVRSPVSMCVMVAERKVMPKSKERVMCVESNRLERISNCASIYVGRVSFGACHELSGRDVRVTFIQAQCAVKCVRCTS